MRSSPDLFNIYSEMTMMELEGVECFIIGGHSLNNLRYGDGTVLYSTVQR